MVTINWRTSVNCSYNTYIIVLLLSFCAFNFLHNHVGYDLQHTFYGLTIRHADCIASRDASYAIEILNNVFKTDGIVENPLSTDWKRDTSMWC